MRVATIKRKNGPIVAVEHELGWLDFSALCKNHTVEAAPAGLRYILTSVENPAEFFRQTIDSAKNLAPYVLDSSLEFDVPVRPGKIVALGRNYKAHAEEFGDAVPTEPLFFVKTATSCIAHGEPVVVKERYGEVHHEGEIAFMVNRRCKDLEPDDARNVIAGYTLLNDVTARTMQNEDKKKGYPWFRSKNLDTFCPIGPAITLSGAVPWPLELALELSVNGKQRQASNTRKFVFSIPETLAYITSFMTLEPGDFVSTGTPEGVGPLKPGDTVTLTGEGLGTLENPVVSG